PAPGSTVGSGSVTFTWEGISPEDEYWLEVYDPGGTLYYDENIVSTASTVSRTITNPSPSPSIFGVRVWTLLEAPDLWGYHDYRFNSDRVIQSCSDEIDLPFGGYSDASCGGICTWSTGGRFMCSAGSSTAGSTINVVSGFVPGDALDIA